MAKIFKYLKLEEWLMACISLIFIVTQVWLDLKLPDYMQSITILVQTPGSAIIDIWIAGGYMLLCTLGSVITAIIVGYFSARIGASFSQELRSQLFSKVESFSMEEINRFSTPSLITRSTNDVTQIQMLIVMALQLLVRAPIMTVWAMTKIAGKGWELSVVTGTGVLIVSIVVVMLIIFVIPKFKKMQTLTDNITRIARENLTGLRVIRAYNAVEYQEHKFESANDDLTSTQMFTYRALAVMMPVMSLIMSGLSLAIYWVSAYLINAAGEMDKLNVFANMVVFSQYAMQVIMSFMMLAVIFVLLPRASVSAKRINEVLDTTPVITDGKETEGKPGVKGEITFKSVSFKYPDAEEYVLEDVSFTVNQGETVAFIGSTGSGKSTLINLVPRFFDATDGEVLIDGINVKDYKLDALLNKIGYVPQKAVLFKGSVNSNVAFGDNGKGGGSGSGGGGGNSGNSGSGDSGNSGSGGSGGGGRSGSGSSGNGSDVADGEYGGGSGSGGGGGNSGSGDSGGEGSDTADGKGGGSGGGSGDGSGKGGGSGGSGGGGSGNSGGGTDVADGEYDSYDEKEIQEAVRIAQATEFVENMDGRYNADISQGGANVSGGQKQRLAIARAIYRKPEIFIFDDSFSALDYKTDRILRSELKRETTGITSLIVAQRIGTIMDADKIIVLDEGKVVGIGTHKELLRCCAVYKEIAMSQLSEEELVS